MACLDVARLDVDDVVLLKEVCRRVEHAHVAEIDLVHCALAVPFADDGHVLTHSEDSKVASERNRLKDSDFVAVDRE